MLINEHTAIFLIIALAMDGFFGEPNWLWQRLPHPVVAMGRLIAFTDKRFNRDGDAHWRRRISGIAALVCWTAPAVSIGLAVTLIWQSGAFPALVLLEIVLVAILLATRSLYEHVDAVRLAFRQSGLAGARKAVSMIVGRNPETLNEAAVCRASIESAAENFSDGVVAPALWYLIAGLPGILAYKTINTADSMIGHRTPRHEAFGWAAARLDDIVNLAPARLSAIFIIVAAPFAGGTGFAALRSVWHDAGKHRSPNAGWPEAAMAGALGLALAGPRTYGDRTVQDAWMNSGGRQEAEPADIARALRLMIGAAIAMALAIAAIAGWIAWLVY